MMLGPAYKTKVHVNPQNNDTVLLVPGLGSSTDNPPLSYLVNSLKQHFSVAEINFVNTHPRRWPLNVLQRGQSIIEFIQAAGLGKTGKLTIIGHSLGGTIAELFYEKIRRATGKKPLLIMVSTFPYSVGEFRRLFEMVTVPDQFQSRGRFRNIVPPNIEFEKRQTATRIFYAGDRIIPIPKKGELPGEIIVVHNNVNLSARYAHNWNHPELGRKLAAEISKKLGAVKPKIKTPRVIRPKNERKPIRKRRPR